MSWIPLPITIGRRTALPTTTNITTTSLVDETSQSPATSVAATRRRRRKRPVVIASFSDSKSTLDSSHSTLSPMMNRSEPFLRSMSSGSMSQTATTLPTLSSDATPPIPRQSKMRRTTSSGGIGIGNNSKPSCIKRCCCYLKPMTILQILGLAALGRVLYSHYTLLSLSHQRTLWMHNKSNPAGLLLDALLPSYRESTNPSILYNTLHTAVPNWLVEQRQGRVQKTRPIGVADSNLLPTSVGGTTTTVWRKDQVVLNASDSDHTEWKELCQKANMNSGSRVLITNVLSHPTGSAVAKLIAKQCGVQKIIGADPILPNLRSARMTFMTVLKGLMRIVPNVQMVVTEPGMGLYEKNRLHPLAWFARARPTHVLLLDPLESPVVVESFGGLSSFKLYAMQQIRHVWKDLTIGGVQQLPVRILHVASPLLKDLSQSLGEVTTSSWDVRIPFSFATMSLPPLSGPGIYTELQPDNTETIFVEQGLRAILTGWQRPKQFFSVDVIPSLMTASNILETSIWHDHEKHPFGLAPPSSNQTIILQSRQRMQSHGSDPVVLPCASQCQESSSLRTCSATAWDHSIDASRKASDGCKFVLFMANFSTHLDEAPTHSADPALCRFMYIARKSPLAKKYKSKTNGKVSSNDWKIVWLDFTEKSYSSNDSDFLRIDPSRLFHSSVQKAIYVNSLAFASAPDQALLRILNQIDSPAVGEGDRSYREIRPGTDLKRWRPLPAEPARRAALFVGTPMPENRPETLPDYKNMLGNAVSKRQVVFYQQLAHWVHVNMDRPESEIRSTVYLKFPFEWTSRYFVVHDLTLETARHLRCDWLEEHLTWNTKSSFWNTEDLSLAFVLGSMKTLGKMGSSVDEFEPGWLPFLNREDEPLLEGESQVYLRLMQPRED